jgi:hypothetical protein
MTSRKETSRREIFAGVAGVAAASALPAPAAAGVSAKEAKWREIESTAARLHPYSALAVHRARLMGLDPDDCTGVACNWVDQKVTLLFGSLERGNFVVVEPDRAYRWREG